MKDKKQIQEFTDSLTNTCFDVISNMRELYLGYIDICECTISELEEENLSLREEVSYLRHKS